MNQSFVDLGMGPSFVHKHAVPLPRVSRPASALSGNGGDEETGTPLHTPWSVRSGSAAKCGPDERVDQDNFLFRKAESGPEMVSNCTYESPWTLRKHEIEKHAWW